MLILSHTAVAYDMTYFSPEAQREFNNIMAQVKPEMSDVEKLLAVHDYIVLHYEYDNNHMLNTAEEALANKRGSCQGYAEIMICVMDSLGLENAFVRSYSMDHSWNMVKLDGEWYHIDVTWDDPVSDTYGYVRHDFFLISDDTISDDYHMHYDWNIYDWDEFIWYEDYGRLNIKATSKTYDEYFWTDINSPMQYYNGKWYWNAKYGSDNIDAGISCYTFSEDKIENIINSYNISEMGIYNGYIYFLDSDDTVYMTPVNKPKNIAVITVVDDYNGLERYELNGIHFENGYLKYAIADDKYYMMKEDPQYGEQAAYPDYYKYRYFYSINLQGYIYSDYAVNWTYSDGTLTLGSNSGMISVANNFDKPWSDYNNEITNIVIRNGVKEIGADAFSNLNNLKTVSLPDSLETIGERAFQYCKKIRTINIPKNVSLISESAFEYCHDLAFIFMSNGIKKLDTNAFYGCWNLGEVYYSGTEDDFNKIIIRDGNYRITDSDIICNYEVPMLVHIFDDDNNIVALWLYNNKVMIGDRVQYNLKRYYNGKVEIYSDAIYSYDDGILEYTDERLYGLNKGKCNVSIKVGNDSVSFYIYVGEYKTQPFEDTSFGYNITPIIALYDTDGVLLDCHVYDMPELYTNGINYIDYGGCGKLFLWEGLGTMKPVNNECIIYNHITK